MKVHYFQKGANVSESVISKDTAVEVKAQTIDRRRLHNRTLRGFAQGRMFTICKHRWFSGCLAGVEGILNNLPDGEREQSRPPLLETRAKSIGC